MAFSTQKDFFKIGFFNDDSQSAIRKKRSDGALKTYNSCTDVRSWSLDGEKRARYLYDLIHAGVDKMGGDREICGNRRLGREELCRMTEDELIEVIVQLYKEMDVKNETLGYTELLLHDAVIKLQNIEAIVEENEDLRNSLKSSEEKLTMVINENTEIKNKIKCHKNCEKLLTIRNEMCIKKTAGLLTPQLELKYRAAEVQELDKQLEQIVILEEEIKKLKINNLVLNERNNFTVTVEQDVNTDPAYLQNIVKNLRTKVAYMDKLEHDYGAAKMEIEKLQGVINQYETDCDLNTLKQRSCLLDDVINEREKMRKQLDRMAGFEEKLCLMRKVEKERNDLLDRLQDQLKNNGCVEKQKGEMQEKLSAMENHLSELERLRKERDSYKNRIDKFADMEAEYEFLIEKCQDYDKILSQMELYKIRYCELVDKEKKMRLKIQFAAGLEKELFEVKSQLCRAECIIKDNEENIFTYIENINELNRQLECKNNQLCAMSQCMKDMNDLKDTVDSLQQKVINSIEDNVMDYSETVIKDGHVNDLVETTKHALKAVHEEFEARARLEQEMDELKQQLSVCYRKDSNVSDKADYENLLNEFNKLKAKLAEKENELKNLENELMIKAEGSIKSEIIIAEMGERPAYDYELQKAAQQNDELKKILSRAKDELEALKNENDELKAKENALINSLATCKDKISNLEDEATKLKNLLEEERKRNADLVEQAKLFKDLQAENERLKNALQEKDSLIADLNDQLNKLKKELVDKNDEIKKLEKDLTNLENELTEQRELLEKAKDEIENFRNEIKHLGEELASEKNLNNSANESSAKSVAEKENQIKSLENKNKELEDELNKLRQQIGDLEKLLASKTNECDDLKNKVQTLSSELSTLKDNLSDLKNQLQDAKTTNDLLKNNLNNLQSEVQNLKQALTDKDGEIKNLKDEKNELNQKIGQLNDQVGDLNKSIADSSNTNKDLEDDLRNQLKALLAENQLLKNDINTLKDQIDKLTELVTDIESEREKNKKLLAAIDDMQNQINTMHKPMQTESALFHVKNLTDSIDKLTSQLDAEMARNNELEELIKKLQKELDELRPLLDCKNQLAAAEAKLKLLENTGGAQIANVEHLSKQSSDFSKRNHQLENDLEELRKQLNECKKDLKPHSSSHAQTLDLIPRSSVQTQHSSESLEIASVKEGFEKKLSSIQQLHKESIQSLQLIHESQMENLQNEHDMESSFLKMSLENLSLKKTSHDAASQKDIKKKDKASATLIADKNDNNDNKDNNGTLTETYETNKNICTCGQIPKLTKSSQNKLNTICKQILNSGFDSLNMEQLSYLHEQVYLAGLRLNPEMEGAGGCGCEKSDGKNGNAGGLFGAEKPEDYDGTKPKKIQFNSKNQHEVRILKLEKELRKAHIILQNFKDMNRYEEMHNKFFEDMIVSDKNQNLGLSLMNEVSKKVLNDTTIPYQNEFDKNKCAGLKKKKQS